MALRSASAVLLRARCSTLSHPTAVSRTHALRLTVAVSNSRGWVVVSRVRLFSADAAAGQKPRPAPGTEQQKQEGTAEESEAAEEDYYAEEPLAARISRYIWGTIKLSFGLGILGFVGYAGYSIVTALLPGGASANAIMRRTSDILRADNDVSRAALAVGGGCSGAALYDERPRPAPRPPQLVEYFGEGIKVYGEDYGGRAEGRRYFVPDFSYTDKWDGQNYHRCVHCGGGRGRRAPPPPSPPPPRCASVKFNVEGAGGKKGTVWAEVRKGTSTYRYIIVLSRDHSRVWSLVDERTPEPTEEERRRRVTTLLQDNRWDFFVDNEVDASAQAAVLSDSWAKIRCVRCDATPSACAEAGVLGTLPTWGERAARAPVPAARGVLQLDELEQLARDHVGKSKTLFQTVADFFGF